jgi:hypothetical protein
MLAFGPLNGLGWILISSVAFFLIHRWRKGPKAGAILFAVWLCLTVLILLVTYDPLVLLLLIFGFGFGMKRTSPKFYRRLSLRVAVSLLWLSFTALFAFAFYERFWIWRNCFNELGRCYDSEAGVMVEQAGAIWGIPTLIFALLFLRSLWHLLRQRTTAQNP